MIILGTNSIKDTSYDVANSLRFDHGSTDYLNRSVGGNSTLNTKGTFSTWLKRSTPADSRGALFSGYVDVNDRLYVTTNHDNLFIFGKVGGTIKYNLKVERNLRDPSAWMNIVVAVDTTQGTAADRVKAYINGVQQTIAITASPDQNSAIPWAATSSYNLLVGRIYATQLEQGLDGYQAETVFVDGLALDQTSFGEFDSDSPTIWKPKNVSGLTFGNNGFYLEYKESGTSQNSSGLGADTSGNDNHFAVNNLTSVDQSIDTCTNNFATLNPLIYESRDNTFADGNLKVTGGGSDSWTTHYGVSTIAVSSGKWYVEAKVTTTQTSQGILGIISTTQPINSSLKDAGRATVETSGRITVFGSNNQTGLTAFSNGDIAAIAFDADNGTAQFYRNGSAYGNAVSSIPSDEYYFATTTYDSGGVVEFNFGSPAFSISTGNTDGNGYGNFEYSVPSNYYALNTKNLAEYG